jgi:hypothetical protein
MTFSHLAPELVNRHPQGYRLVLLASAVCLFVCPVGLEHWAILIQVHASDRHTCPLDAVQFSVLSSHTSSALHFSSSKTHRATEPQSHSLTPRAPAPSQHTPSQPISNQTIKQTHDQAGHTQHYSCNNNNNPLPLRVFRVLRESSCLLQRSIAKINQEQGR